MYHARHRYSPLKTAVREQGGWRMISAAAAVWMAFVVAICAAAML